MFSKCKFSQLLPVFRRIPLFTDDYWSNINEAFTIQMFILMHY